MKVLIYLGHPAHFHLFKNTIKSLKLKGYDIKILIKKKDILEELLLKSKFPYLNILPEGRKDSKPGIAWGVIKRDLRLLRLCLTDRPDLMIGTSTEIAHIGSLLKIPSINVNEDDADVVPFFSKLSYPWSKYILSPSVCQNGKWEKKSIKYQGYHELAYLHPNHFTPSKKIVETYISLERPYFLIRFAKLNAHHDRGIRGITDDLALKIINILKPHGNIYITSERKFDTTFEPYRLQMDPLEIHHVMAFASIFIGDSQTMAAESGVLGVPFIRYNDFVGRISYLNELENKYKLGFGVHPSEPSRLLEVINELLIMKDRNYLFDTRRKQMLHEKINVDSFLLWFIESYPSSVDIMKKTPEFQKRFIKPF
jgi:uncharacterized protein